MMKAYLFGAGASHSYSQSPTGLRPPLAKGVFDAYQDLDISGDRYVLVGSIVNYVRDTRGVDPLEFGQWNENVESFLTEIAEQISTKEKALALDVGVRFLYSKAYDEMVFLFASVLNEIQNGPPCAEYAALVEGLGRDDVLITFNWDALLDRVLWESGGWNPRDGYGLRFEGFFDDGWGTTPTTTRSKHKLLKLHGSTNWLMPFLTLDFRAGTRKFLNPALEPPARPLYCFIKAAATYETYRNRSRDGYEPFSYYYYPPDIPIPPPKERGRRLYSFVSAFDLPEHGEVTPGGHPYASMPVIIPPVREKEYGILGNALDEVWLMATDAIARCDELIVIGYSFPPTDTRAWDLLREASRQSRTALRITVVGPHSESVVQRMKTELTEHCEIQGSVCTFSEYVGLWGTGRNSGLKGLTEREFYINFKHMPEPEAKRLMIDEREWYADDAENFLGVVMWDKTDEDWAFAILARDPKGIFRWIDGRHSLASIDEARHQLFDMVEKYVYSGKKTFSQD